LLGATTDTASLPSNAVDQPAGVTAGRRCRYRLYCAAAWRA
jgi:hypothetical protein